MGTQTRAKGTKLRAANKTQRGANRLADAQYDFLGHGQHRAACLRLKVIYRLHNFYLASSQGKPMHVIGPFVRAFPPDEHAISLR